MTLGQSLKKYRVDHDLSMDMLVAEFNRRYGLKTTKSMMSRWENDLATPTNAYLAAYARYFNLDLNSLLGIDSAKSGYYTDPEVAELAEMLRTNPEYRIMFDASKNLSKEDIKVVTNLIKSLKEKEGIE